MRHSLWRLCPLLCWALVIAGAAHADNPLQHNGVDRVYDPYVQATEKELELRTLYQKDARPGEDGILRQRLAYGFSLNERVFLEAYAIAKKLPQQSMGLEAYELEAKWQLTEQGQYSADWGLLLEYERKVGESAAEFSAALLGSRQWGAWTGTVNLGVEYEFGAAITDEVDRFLSAQWRYRYTQVLEPGLEFYADEFTRGIGPVLTGTLRGQNKNKWYWEAGLILPLNDTTPDQTLRFLLEYEF